MLQRVDCDVDYEEKVSDWSQTLGKIHGSKRLSWRKRKKQFVGQEKIHFNKNNRKYSSVRRTIK